MAVVSPSDVQVGQTIAFRTLNPRDTVKYVCQVSGICTYQTARKFMDVDVYHQQVTQNQHIGDVKGLTFLILTRTSADGNSEETLAYAREWISPSSLEVVTNRAYVDIRVYNIPLEKVSDVINVIKASGYDASMLG